MRMPSLLALALLSATVAGCAKKPSLVDQSYFAGKDYWVVIINKDLMKDSGDLVPIARDICKEKDICVVGMWLDKTKAPNLVPMTPQQTRDQIFVYGWRAETKRESLGWNCRLYPAHQAAGDCIAVPLNQ